MKRRSFFLLIGLVVLFSVFLTLYSYIFVDPNLALSSSPRYQVLSAHLSPFLRERRGVAGLLYMGFAVVYFAFYLSLLSLAKRRILTKNNLFALLAASSILVFSFPAFSYDLFNYIATAKVTFHYHENPYVVMPIELVGEPMLAFTRAANKLALYGPTWTILSGVPHAVGGGTVWPTILTFKAFTFLFYLFLTYCIYKVTRSVWSAVFFAYNPLVLFEVLVSGHNDVVMMGFAVAALLLLRKRSWGGRVLGVILFLLSIGVKWATLVLAPVLAFFHRWKEKLWQTCFWFMFGVFLLTPLREELYPWYAVWFIPFAALVPGREGSFIHPFTIAFTLGLVLRHIPYIVMGEYGGSGPFWRTFVTFLPVGVWMTWLAVEKLLRNKFVNLCNCIF